MKDAPMDRPPELVLGLERDAVPGGLDWRGVRAMSLDPVLDAVRARATFRPRTAAEQDGPEGGRVVPLTRAAPAARQVQVG